MPSTREQILTCLTTKLKLLETPTCKVYRNLDKAQQVPSGGIIVLHDGVSGEPEILLSPLTYIYEHLSNVDVLVQHPDLDMRNSALDALLVQIGTIIATNRTLNNLAEWVEARAPEFADEPIEGAPTIRGANLQIMVRYSTPDPLN